MQNEIHHRPVLKEFSSEKEGWLKKELQETLRALMEESTKCWRRKAAAHSHLHMRVSRKANLRLQKEYSRQKRTQRLERHQRVEQKERGVDAVILRGEGLGSLWVNGTGRFKIG